MNTTMRKVRTVLLFNLFLQLFLLDVSSASLSSSTPKSMPGAPEEGTTAYDLTLEIKDVEQDEKDTNFGNAALLMEIDSSDEEMIERHLNSTAPKHPPKNKKKHSSGGSSGGGGSGSSSGSSGGSSGRSSGASSGASSGGSKSSKKSKPKKLASGYMMYGVAAVAVAGVAAAYQNQNREIVVEGEPHALRGSIARRMARFDKMAGKASPEARGSGGMVQMSSSSFYDGESYNDDGSTVYVNMESRSNSSNLSTNSNTGGGHAMAMV